MQSVTAGHIAPRCRARAARASNSEIDTSGASRVAAARTPAHKLGHLDRSHASGAAGLCASAAFTSTALKPNRSASVISRASSRPRSASRRVPAPASASTDPARVAVLGSGEAACTTIPIF